ncbi:hypothetical protein D9611_000808 [Ephemerocybe angulata]|uniref:Uncharacterized protein n=1 Tax=Ephemerocybe angulata TaxID=980116 RepID=A0A8H5F6U1_9AGAR|nr:hypothetical protein D9611_000808 [Tulosesus angulatus]
MGGKNGADPGDRGGMAVEIKRTPPHSSVCGFRRLSSTKGTPSRRGWDNKDTVDPFFNGFSERLSSLVGLLRNASHRWRKAQLSLELNRGNRGSELLPLLDIPTQDVPLLEALRLCLTGGDQMAVTPVLLPTYATGLLKAPTLRMLSLCRIREGLETLAGHWEFLTELEFDGYSGEGMTSTGTALYFSLAEAFALLKRCPNLVRCDLAVVKIESWLSNIANWASNSVDYGPDGVTLHRLQDLALRVSVPGNGFASALQLPSLRTLSFIENADSDDLYLHPAPPPEDSDTSPLAEWIQCFGNQLSKCQFNYVRLTQSALEYCLERLPRLVSLRLDGSGIYFFNSSPYYGTQTRLEPAVLNDQLWEKLIPRPTLEEETVDSSQSCWCPRLEEIHISGTLGGSTFVADSLLRFIISRRNRTSGLAMIRKVKVTFGTPETMDIRKELEARKVDLEDFDLNITYPTPIRLVSHSLL